ncbi:MAG: hypothetical protein JO344_02310, partial [Planctomycetaceae bacterium]|nr:hypothetical protein [Planctomycetaceae bacterium]
PFIAWSVTIRAEETIEYFEQPRTVVRVKARLSELLSDVWKDQWLKAPPRKRRLQQQKQQKRTHSSVYRFLEAHQLRLKKEKRGVAVA